MCGIGGVVHPGIAVPRGVVETMTAKLLHRGPDAQGSRSFAQCALVHTRLRVVYLSPLGDQPMANEDGTVWVVFNGEIYNFRELRAELEGAGHRFRSCTDTEVLVHLYEAEGDAMVARLRGMFAFAVWDERAQRLLLGRDRLGMKPLYYRADGAGLRFSSEVRAVADSGDDLDAGALNAYLRLGWVTGPRTVRAAVRELAPGHVLTWEEGATRAARYWSPSFSASPARKPSGAELGETLRDATRRHLVADVPVGVFLSSGVDSAVVGALAAQVQPGVRGYTVAFEAGADEAAGAAEVARRVGLDHTVVRISGADVLGALDEVVAAMDQPTVDGVNSWVVSRAVREAGVVVALSGLGGDELFAGYSTFRHIPRLARAGRATAWLPAQARRAPERLAGRVARTSHGRVRRAVEAVASGGWEHPYAAVRGLFGEAELHSIWPCGPAGVPAEGVVHPAGTGARGARGMVGRLELGNYLPFQLLRDTDCMSMAHALEVRVPLLDDEVVRLAATGLGAGGPWNKERLLSAAAPDLADLARRPKQTFTLPFDRWMRGPLRDPVLGALARLGQSDLGFDRRRLSDLWFGYQAGRASWRQVWALAVLGMWMDRNTSAGTGVRP